MRSEPSSTECASSWPRHMTHKLCVSSSVRNLRHGGTHFPQCSLALVSHMYFKQTAPEDNKSWWRIQQVPFYTFGHRLWRHRPYGPIGLALFHRFFRHWSWWRSVEFFFVMNTLICQLTLFRLKKKRYISICNTTTFLVIECVASECILFMTAPAVISLITSSVCVQSP